MFQFLAHFLCRFYDFCKSPCEVLTFFYRDIIKPPYQIFAKKKKGIENSKIEVIIGFSITRNGYPGKKEKKEKKAKNETVHFLKCPLTLRRGKKIH
jgi:hypothetical protein